MAPIYMLSAIPLACNHSLQHLISTYTSADCEISCCCLGIVGTAIYTHEPSMYRRTVVWNLRFAEFKIIGFHPDRYPDQPCGMLVRVIGLTKRIARRNCQKILNLGSLIIWSGVVTSLIWDVSGMWVPQMSGGILQWQCGYTDPMFLPSVLSEVRSASN